MIFENKVPEWRNVGAEPPDDLKDKGFQAGYKPPAAYFNWFFYGIYQCIAEMQTSFDEVTNPDIDALDDIIVGPGGSGEVAGNPITNEDIDMILRN